MAIDIETIFSREALTKLRSPERLDTMLKVTTPITWMALAGIVVLMFAVVMWSVFGSFTVKADGMGMIVDSGGVSNVTHSAAGQVKDIYVSKGTKVKKGERLASLYLSTQETDTMVSRYNINQAQNDREVMNKALEYDAKANQKMDNDNVYSEYDGIVDEVIAHKGEVVQAGAPLFTVRRTEGGNNLTGVFYIPVDKGKRVQPGMTIQLAPNGVDTSQSGSLLGVVRSVSQYPISQAGVQQGMAGNQQVSQWLYTKSQSALIEVKFDLVTDANSESGYLWTSTVGKHKPITAGSFCTGSIIIERTPPLQKVFYKFSQWLRNR